VVKENWKIFIDKFFEYYMNDPCLLIIIVIVTDVQPLTTIELKKNLKLVTVKIDYIAYHEFLILTKE